MENRSAKLDSLSTKINQQHSDGILSLIGVDYLLALMDSYVKLHCILEIL